MVWYVYPEKETDHGSIAFAVKHPDARCFGKPKLILKSTGLSYGNPTLFVRSDGTLVLLYVVLQGSYWNDSEIFMTISQDQGEHWSSSQRVFEQRGLMIRHPPLKVGPRHWLLGIYDETEYQSMILESFDDGNRFELTHTFPRKGLIQPALIEYQNKIYCFFRPMGDPKVIWFAYLRHKAWSVVKSLEIPCPLSGFAVTAHAGQILITYNHTHQQKRTPLSISTILGEEEGLYPGGPWHFESADFEVSYPTMISSAQSVDIVYTYNRRMLKSVVIEHEELRTRLPKAKPLRGQVFGDQISDYHNLHLGKKLFILASGPSLGDLDLSRLKHRITMGLNRSCLVFEQTSYHCVMDQRLFDEYGELLKKTRTLFTLEGRPFGLPMRLLGSEGFSDDLSEGVYSGYTVSYVALQLAVYMGFKEVFFLGLDMRHRQGKTHFFGSDFRSESHEHTEFPKMIRMLNHAAETLAHHDIKVYNCSLQSKLECFEKLDFNEAIKR